jgi:hypothetical protein
LHAHADGQLQDRHPKADQFLHSTRHRVPYRGSVLAQFVPRPCFRLLGMKTKVEASAIRVQELLADVHLKSESLAFLRTRCMRSF